MAPQVAAARYTVYSGAWMKDNAVESVTMNSSMAKIFATEVAFRNVNETVQIFGDAGASKGCSVEKHYRQVRGHLLYEAVGDPADRHRPGIAEGSELYSVRKLLGGDPVHGNDQKRRWTLLLKFLLGGKYATIPYFLCC